jgi:hypothetical protein
MEDPIEFLSVRDHLGFRLSTKVILALQRDRLNGVRDE